MLFARRSPQNWVGALAFAFAFVEAKARSAIV
jgi:hypothetical protein